MGKTDISCFLFWRKNPDCYAELFNRFVFGSDLVKAESLRELNIKAVNKKTNITRYRDNFREAVSVMEDERRIYILLGIEDSSYIDYAAPVRTMLYDAANLSEQISGDRTMTYKSRSEFLSGFPKDRKLKPVITVYMNWSGKPWNGNRSLFEMYDERDLEVLRSYLNDYQIHVISADELDETDILGLRTELREVLGYQKYMNDPEELLRIADSDAYRFKNLSLSTAEFINEVTRSGLKLEYENEENGENINMCKAIDMMRHETAVERAEKERYKKELEAVSKKCRGIRQETAAEKERYKKELERMNQKFSAEREQITKENAEIRAERDRYKQELERLKQMLEESGSEHNEDLKLLS